MCQMRAHFLEQAAACAELESPLTARVLRLIAARMERGTPVMDTLMDWPAGTWRTDAVALRLAGGLHGLVRSGRDAPLAAFYARPDDSTDADATAVLHASLARHADFLLAWLSNAPQTNEVRRSAVLIAVGHWLTERVRLPIVLSELGASAGLNLIWDHYRLEIGAGYGPATSGVVLRPKWRGAYPPQSNPVVVARAGVDLRPLHAVTDQERLLSYIWPDQAERLERTAAAAVLAGALAPPVRRGDAVDWLQIRLRALYPGRLHIVFHTIAWQYFPPQAQQHGRALLAEAGRRATLDAPLARIAMEADARKDGAGVTVQLWPGGETLEIARADFHGRWIDWRAP